MLPLRNCELKKNDNNCNYSINLKKGIGLGILVQFQYSPQPNLVVNKSRKLAQFNGSSTKSSNYYKACSFLKTCCLCNNNLDPHEDIYMYRGDEGYCSPKCRNKQIENDEKRELEASTKKIIASLRRQCHRNEATETGLILQDLRRQNNRIPHSPLVS